MAETTVLTHKRKQIAIKICVNISRLVLALTFLFSGFVKANDPFGTVYKMQDYLASFGLFNISETLVLICAIMLALLEFTMGTYLLVGINRSKTAKLTVAFMAAMTLLTVYIFIFNPVSDCGCFGEVLILTNGQTLLKNIVLLSMSILVLKYRLMQTELISDKVKWIFSMVAMAGIVAYSVCCVIYLPIIDFSAYKLNTDLLSAFEKSNDPNLFDIKIVYERNGETLELSPEDDDPDDSWHYVETKRTLTDEDVLKTAGFYTNDPATGDEVTEDVLNEDMSLLLIIPDLRNADESCIDRINEIYEFSKDSDIRFHCLTASADEKSQNYWIEHTGAEYSFLLSDERVLKTVVRAKPGLVLMRQGVIKGKWSNYNMPTPEELNEFIAR